jgi:hypothetical protein
MPTLRIMRNAVIISNMSVPKELLQLSNSAHCTVKVIRLCCQLLGLTGDSKQRFAGLLPAVCRDAAIERRANMLSIVGLQVRFRRRRIDRARQRARRADICIRITLAASRRPRPVDPAGFYGLHRKSIACPGHTRAPVARRV